MKPASIQSVAIDGTSHDRLLHAEQLWHAGETNSAASVCHEILRDNPLDPDAMHLLGRILLEIGQPFLSMAMFEGAVALDPGSAQFSLSLGEAFLRRGQWEEALVSFRRALAIDIQNTKARLYEVIALVCLNHWDEAKASLDEAPRRESDITDAAFPIASALLLRLLTDGGWEQAEDMFQRTIALVCDFPRAHSAMLFALHYLPGCKRETLRDAASAWALRHAAHPQILPATHNNPREPERRLCIGYVSADFCRHPVGYFLESVLAAHDRQQVEVFCYANQHVADNLTERLRATSDHWHNIAELSDDAAVQKIRADGIDMLIDLSGHTAGNRLTLFARKPAPVQATWLGYSDTTGIPNVDYLIADRFVCAECDDALYVEKVIRLPEGYQCYRPQADVSVSTRPEFSGECITFGCFNALAKIGPEVADCWAEILRALPEANLCLKCGKLELTQVREQCVRMFAERGVPAGRLRLLGRSAHEEHLAAYGEIDIALDPFPCNGGTNTVEALWMGVPVISLKGDRFISRVGFSHLSAVGLDDLAADSPGEYVRIAIALARNAPRRAALRTDLRRRLEQSSLGNARRFTPGLEAAYRYMWRQWCGRARQN